ncbi:nucleoside 2-deoxyribosyltransferase [Bacillus sinesaloumensis]|uniref:nucleoside 2-deoxyribosyltransferase n=1 Tax=Litchfieldia sinesaloumensis TaxID=1926280 RepID=UPI0009887D44|nr:nucleoside 2-deoxyribosyltransferase [Bacillus sinesaloumensis]
MNRFYVASSFNNIETVRNVSNQLKGKGYIHTYDWTRNERATTIEDLREIGLQEINAVKDADFIIVLLPAGKGSHIELGIALGQGKRIYLYSPNHEINNPETTSTFYHVSEVQKCIGTIEELIEIVTSTKAL